MANDAPTFFFSYARSDGEFALKLATDLRAGGARVWVDQLDIAGGQRWDMAIENALRTCQGMVVILSPESVSSNNVLDEVSYALEHDKLIVPVIHRSCEVPYRLRRLQRIDLTSSYQVGLDRLLKAVGIRDLGASAPPTEVAASAGESMGKTAAAIKKGSAPQDSSSPQAKPKLHRRTNSALLGAVSIVALTLAVGLAWTGLNFIVHVLTAQAMTGAIAGALVGDSRFRLVSAAIGVGIAFLVAAVISTLVADYLTSQRIVLFSLGLGAVVGAIVGLLLERSRAR